MRIRISDSVSCIAAALLLTMAATTLPKEARAQEPAGPPIDVMVQFLFNVETTDACVERVRAGFRKAGYINIADETNANAVKGVVAVGDTAGVSSMVACVPVGGGVNIALASAGAGTLGDFAPQTQNNRLLGAINNP